MKKNIVKLMVIIALTMAVVPVSTAQSVSIWDGTSEIWTQGSGTETNPFLIENAQQLAYIAEMVNGGVTHYDNTYFKLTTNVYIDSLTAWEPIGLNETYYFGGHFDGDNHLVTLYLATSLQYVGIFGYAKTGGFANLNSAGQVRQVRQTSTPSVSYAGGICGYSTSSFSNCLNTVDISSSNSNSNPDSYVGGICGYVTATVTNCHNTGNISSYRSGGICGAAYAAVINCHNAGDISAIYCSGGICGTANAAVINCQNTGDISASSSCICISGGICGTASDTISLCNNIANVSSNSTSTSGSCCSYAGGICGTSGTTIIITNCYNIGDISSVKPNNYGAYAGGICCYGYGPSIIINNCYNVGSLLSGTNKGGIIGGRGSSPSGYPYGIITNCHYLNTCGHNTSTPGTAKTEAQMKSSSFPVILNTDSVVFVKDITPNINQGYPVFGSVRTLAADSIGTTTATLRGDYHMLYDVDAHGFEYKKTSESDYTTVTTTGYSPVSKPLTGLQGSTQYTYRFFVQKDGVYYRGEDRTFNTVQCNLTAQITSSSNTLCDGDTVVYTASASSSLPSTYQFTWNTGDHSNAISVSDGASYTVTVTDAYGCTAIQTKQMTLYPAAVASISGGTVLCDNGSTTLTANGGNTYFWNTGSAQRIITVNQPGIYIATVQTVYGCTASDTVEVVAFANPVINGNTVFCSGDYTTLTATGGESYQWSTGATTASINVSTAGNYSVTVSTSNGCSGSASVTVIQNQADNVTISGNTVICSGIGTTLTASSGANYIWSTGETTQSITANNPGVYSVTVTNSNGCSNSTTQTVSLMEQTTISGNNHICSGQSTTLSANGSGSYAWSNGANTSFITVNTPGNYSVTVTMSNGCASSASLVVTIGTTPTPTILGNTTICQGETTILTATGGVSYAWSNGGTSNSTTVNQSGVYTVIATNAEGCSATANVTVTVNPLPTITIGGNTTVCAGNSTMLTASGANSYSWSTGDNTASVTINAFGVYTVTGTSSEGCSNTASVTVLVSQLPNITITGMTDICVGESTTLTANGGETYLWSDGTTNNTLTVSTAGTYQVIGYNAAGCNAMASATVNVWQHTTSEFTITTPDSCYTWNAESYCTSGDYTQPLQTVHGCDSIVTLHLTITVGIDEHNLSASMTVYPNPTTGVVNVECTMDDVEMGAVEFQLFDAFGRLLRTTDGVGANNDSPLRTNGHGSSAQTQIDLSHYAAGVYFIKAVANEKVVAVRKVMKR